MGKNLLIIMLLTVFVKCSYSQIYDPKQQLADAKFMEGYKYYNLGKYQEAINLYLEGLEAKPDYTRLYYWLGKAYYKAGLMEDCVKAWEEFLELGGGDRELRRKIKSIFYHEYKAEVKPIVTYEYLGKVMGERFDRRRFYNPTGIAVDKEGNLYVASFSNRSTLKLTSTGGFILKITRGGGKDIAPFDVSLDGEGNIYITDFDNARVLKYDKAGKFLSEFSEEGLLAPEGVSVDKEGNVLVVDSGTSRIYKFDPTGKCVMSFGTLGSGAGEFILPVGIACGENGHIFVSDSGNNRIQEFDRDGNFIAQFYLPSEGEPRGITIHRSILYVCDAKEGVLYSFNMRDFKWNTLKAWDDGKRKFSCPQDVAVGEDGLVYVADYDHHCVYLFMPEKFKDTQFDVMVDWVDTSNFPKILLAVTVSTRGKRVLLGLKEDNFKIVEDERRMFPIGVSTPYQKREYSLFVFLIDTGESVPLDEVKALLSDFIDKMLPNAHWGAIVGFNREVYVVEEKTLNKDKLLYEISNLSSSKEGERVGGVVFKAVYEAVGQTMNVAMRRAIVLFTCGGVGEEEGFPLFEKCLYYAKNNYTPVYVIDYRVRGETPILQKLADETGGLYLSAYRSPEVKNLFHTVESRMKRQNQYFLYYNSPTTKWTGSWVDIVVGAAYFGLYAEDRGGYFVPITQRRIPLPE